MNIISVYLLKGLQLLTIPSNNPLHTPSPEKTLGYKSRGMVSITPGEGVEAEKCVFNDFKCIIIFFFCNKYVANNY